MRWGLSVSIRVGGCLSATMEGGAIRCRHPPATMEAHGAEGRGVGPSARCLSRRGRALRSWPQSAGSGPPLVVCARGGSAALGVSVGRAPCVLGRCAPCARGGGLPPRRLACLPLRAPPLAALPCPRPPRPLAVRPSPPPPPPPPSLPPPRLLSSRFRGLPRPRPR